LVLGDSGTGKTHLLIALGTCAAEAGRRVRYLTCAQLVNELAEAADDKQLSRVLGRYARLDLVCLDLYRRRNYAEDRRREVERWAAALGQSLNSSA
jgi:DNA replication protein DnaC